MACHAQLLGALDELRQAAEAVQKGVLRVHVEVNERLAVLRQGHITGCSPLEATRFPARAGPSATAVEESGLLLSGFSRL